MSPLTPDQINSKTFSTAMRGYEKDEVDAYLKELSEEYAAALERPTAAVDPVEKLGAEVTDVLRSARDAAESLRERSSAEAEQIRKRAAEKALELRRKAQEEAEAAIQSAQAEAKKTLELAQARAEQAIRQAEEQAARQRREVAEEVNRIREKTKREAADLLDGAVAKHERLVSHEEQLRARVEAAQASLEELQRALDLADESAEDARHEPPPVPGTGRSDERVWTPEEIASSEPKPVPAVQPK